MQPVPGSRCSTCPVKWWGALPLLCGTAPGLHLIQGSCSISALGGECVNSLAESLLEFDPQRKEVGEEHPWGGGGGGEGATFLPLLM